MVQHKRTIILSYICMAPGGSRQTNSNEAVASDVAQKMYMLWDVVILWKFAR